MTSSFIGKVFDHYRILGNLGEGGMGMVFKAVNIQLDKVVAVKMIAAGMAMNKRFIERFKIEARALARLEDPNIVAIHDLRSDNDLWFIVMEYVDGPNLYDQIKDHGAIPWQESIKILKQILSGLGHAHRAEIIHRDIKPNNIMVNKDGVVKITDFGLAKDQTNLHNSMTVAGGGTLYYMSPEHVKGFSFTDKRSDIYSVGMTFYEMITGKVPFENINTDFEIRETIVRKEIKKPTTFNAEIPLALEDIVMKSIAKDPDERYQSCDEMLQAIQAFELESGIADDTISDINLTTVSGNGTSTAIPAATSDKQSEPGSNKKIYKILVPTFLLIAILLVVVFYPKLFSFEKELPPEPVSPKISVSSTPSQALVLMNGDSAGRTPLQSQSFKAGTYTLHISKENYEATDTTVVLEDGASHSLALVLKPIVEKQIEHPKQVVKSAAKKVKQVQLQASISVRSDPAEAEIWLNGKRIGHTPFQQSKLKPGLYLLKLKKEGFEDFNQKIRLAGGKSRRMDTKLVPIGGSLVIKTQPSGARVNIDGREMINQLTPFDIKNIILGFHQLKVQKTGYAAYQEKIEVKRGETTIKKIELVQIKGKLNIRVIPWGTIYIDNKLQKTSSDIKHEFELPVGKHVLRIVHPTLGKWQKEIRVAKLKITSIKLNFNKKMPIIISATDKNGKTLAGDVYIDGKNIGLKTPADLKLGIGLHSLLVKKTGYIAPGGEIEFLVDPQSDAKHKFLLEKLN